MNETNIKQFNQKFLDAAAHGNLEDLKAFFGKLKDVKIKLNKHNEFSP